MNTVPQCCENCWRFERFGKKCRYYFGGKVECHSWVQSEDDAEKMNFLRWGTWVQ